LQLDLESNHLPNNKACSQIPAEPVGLSLNQRN
jgi:hypothetical protein